MSKKFINVYNKALRIIRLLSAGVIITVMSFGSAQNLWDEENGVAIRQGVHIEWQRTVCPGGDGSVILVWSDTRNGSRNIYAQKVDTTGALLWGEGGVAVTSLPGRQEDPVAIEDGNGGAFIAWADYRFDPEADIFLQHIDQDGQILLDGEGAALCRQPGKQLTIAMCTDSLGGVFVSWQDFRNGVDQDIYGTHVSATHEIVNPGDGVPIIQINGHQDSKSIEYGGNNTALVVWADERTIGGMDIYAQKITTDMSSIFDPEGLAIASEPVLESAPRTTFMRGDTSLIIWQQGESPSEIVYQLINNSGLVFSNPVSISTDSSSRTGARVKRDHDGNVYVTWKDYRWDPVDGDIVTQKVNFNGSINWDTGGVLLDTEFNKNSNVRFTGDENGGAWYFWEKGTFPEIDIIAQHVHADGSIEFDNGGQIISDDSGYQFAPIVTGDLSAGAFVVFADQQTGSIDLSVQHIRNDNSLSFPGNALQVVAGLDGDVSFVNGLKTGNSILLTWEDNRGGKSIFGSTITADGEIVNPDGKSITFGDGHSEAIFAEPVLLESANAFYLATYDASSGSKLIRLFRFDNDLNNAWDSTGIVVYTSTADQYKVALVTTSDGVGCFWSEIRNEIDYDIYYQRFDESGNALLQDGGVVIASGVWVDEYVEKVVVTPDENFLVFWLEDTWGAGIIKYNKIDQNGVPDSGWPTGGYTLAGPQGDPEKLQGVVIRDNIGVLVVWEQLQNFAKDIYAQIINWDGTKVGAANGLVLTSQLNDQSNPDIAIDSVQLKALVVWEDFRNGEDINLFGQVIDLSDFILPDTNIIITNDTTFQQNPVVANVGPDEFIIIWEDERGVNGESPVVSGGMDLYGTGYSIPSGLTTPVDGIPIVREFHNQVEPQITKLNETDYLIHWIDLRSSGKADLKNLYGKLVLKSDFLTISAKQPTVPDAFRITAAYPNPFNGSVNFNIEIAVVIPVEFTVFNLLGQTIYRHRLFPSRPGIQRLNWNGNDHNSKPVASGIYLYTIEAGSNIH